MVQQQQQKKEEKKKIKKERKLAIFANLIQAYIKVIIHNGHVALLQKCRLVNIYKLINVINHIHGFKDKYCVISLHAERPLGNSSILS